MAVQWQPPEGVYLGQGICSCIWVVQFSCYRHHQTSNRPGCRAVSVTDGPAKQAEKGSSSPRAVVSACRIQTRSGIRHLPEIAPADKSQGCFTQRQEPLRSNPHGMLMYEAANSSTASFDVKEVAKGQRRPRNTMAPKTAWRHFTGKIGRRA